MNPHRPPHLAELVADTLRQQILNGTLTGGSLLAKQEDLLAEFGVSKPSLREAMRILEAEGLLRVRRGKLGGSVVRRPNAAASSAVIVPSAALAPLFSYLVIVGRVEPLPLR